MRLAVTMTARVLAGMLILGCAPAPDRPIRQSAPRPTPGASSLDREAAARGARIAQGTCAGCHSVGSTGPSAHAAAPPFRDIVTRRALDDLESSMAEGLLTPHPDMPPFTFRAGEIDDLVAYLDTLRQDGPR